MDSAARPDEEESRRRRSTDCIYFLASPLTCKKGSECEYRHSDAARMNPRDCWYWFNGNCANPKCSFRHPAFDSLLGAPTTPRAAQQSAPQVPVPAQAHGSAPASSTGTAKQGVPCYYFQKGMCAKGDRCAFLHVPQAAGNPAQQPTAKVFTPALQPKPQLENSWTKPNSPAQLNTPSGIFDKSNSIIHGGKLAPKQNVASRVDQSSRIYQNHNTSYVQSGTAKHYQPQPSVKDDLSESGMEVGEFVREPSAGSGVLVGSIEDDAEHSSFKGNHDSYHGTNGEQHTGMMKQRHGNYEAERSHRSSSESLSSEKRISQREPMPVSTGSLDLRHRLLKQRRLNDPRSIQVPDRHDAYLEDELNDHNCWRGEEQAAHESISRSRLRGRIKLPGETSFDSLGSRSEKESDRGPRARVSPPKHTDLRGKLHERLKARSNEDIPGNAKGWVAKASSGEDAGSLNFAGPKSLAELKAKKVVGSSGENAIKSLGSSARVISVVASRDSSEPVVPFEGPKPLSVILKRKRTTMSENAAHSGSIQEDGEEEGTVGVEEESQNKVQILEGDTVEANMEGNAEEEGAFHPEDGVAYDDDSLTPVDGDNAAEDAGKELEEHQDVEAAEDYDYEAADVNAEEDNDYQEYEDDDDLEDDDDFARKVGVMIS